MKKIFNEFKEFSLKGNMIDIAIGVIIGTAFNKVVDAIVKQVFMPPLSILTGGNKMADRRVILREPEIVDGVTRLEEIAIGYGKLIEVFFDFFIIALTVFLVVKFMNKLINKSVDTSDPTVKTPKDIELLDRMTELLEEQNKLLDNRVA